jgi:hypothetical protein
MYTKIYPFDTIAMLTMQNRIYIQTDTPGMRQTNVCFAVTVLLHAINPPIPRSGASNVNQHTGLPIGGKSSMTEWSGARGSSFSARGIDTTTVTRPAPKDSVYEIVFLGLKILIVCFELQISSQWRKIAKCVRELLDRGEGGLSLWNFLDFIATRRSPLYIMLLPTMQGAVRLHNIRNVVGYYNEQSLTSTDISSSKRTRN